jgi:mannosyl-oligosaccharide alpha-1,2-mannosidase
MLYHVMQNTWDEPSYAYTGDVRAPPENPVHPHAEHLKDSTSNPEQVPIKQQDEVGVSSSSQLEAQRAKEDAPVVAQPEPQTQPPKAHSGQEASVPLMEADEAAIKPAAGVAPSKDSAGGQSAVGKTTSGKASSGSNTVNSQDGQAEKPISSESSPSKSNAEPPRKKQDEHWQPVKEHFPVPSGSLISLPTGKPKAIPKIQHKFGPESEASKTKRKQRQSKVKAEIERSWAGYKKYAWMHDELSPVSGKYRDPFCGWAATLVDSLDTLWIAGLKDEFNEAVGAVAKIDFTFTQKSSIPVFETTIRYLGGLLSAFDVSGGHDGKYKILLDKAYELAEILMGIFDTPNRMPILYYSWQPKYASQPHKASIVGIAELATLSMEFTKLAQFTKEDKYYDAVARITNALVEFQEAGYSAIPGLFPQNLDASGCNKTATEIRDSQLEEEKAESFDTYDLPLQEKRPAYEPDVDAHLVRRSRAESSGPDTDTSQPSDQQLRARSPPPASDYDCVPQGLVPAGRWQQPYHVGGAQDSAYEYFPKVGSPSLQLQARNNGLTIRQEYLLLGGLEPKYQKLYEDAVEAIDEWLMYRPMTKEDDEWDVLFPAKVFARGDGGETKFEFEITHLTCFVGGMYGLGGRAFGREKDVETAKKLTDGCVWAYHLTATGLMAETAQVLPCPTLDRCEFNETQWWAALDPSKQWHDSQVAEWDLKYGKQAQTAMSSREIEGDVGQQPYSASTASTKAGDGTLMKRGASEHAASRVVEARVGEPYNPAIVGEDNLERDRPGGQRASPIFDDDSIPERPVSHEEYARNQIELGDLPPGFTKIQSRNYILRYGPSFLD